MKVRKMVMWLSVALVGLVVSACASDEPKTEINDDFVQACEAGSVTRYYELDELIDYELEGSKWVKSSEPMIGFYMNDDKILFKDGKFWTPLHIFCDAGTTKTLSMVDDAWDAYKKKSRCKDVINVAIPFKLNKEENELICRAQLFHRDSFYNVEKFTKKEIRLFDYGIDGNYVQRFKTVYVYKPVEMSQTEIDRIIPFDSEVDAYYYVLRVCKEYFGDEINYQYMDRKYKVDLNELEDRLDAEMY